jgi:hypothetical protein
MSTYNIGTSVQIISKSLIKSNSGPIYNYYNTNKPDDWMPLRMLRQSEYGFQIELTPQEIHAGLAWAKFNKREFTVNDTIRKLILTDDGYLKSQGNIGFTEEQTKLLYMALKHSLGEDKVIIHLAGTYSPL